MEQWIYVMFSIYAMRIVPQINSKKNLLNFHGQPEIRIISRQLQQSNKRSSAKDIGSNRDMLAVKCPTDL